MLIYRRKLIFLQPERPLQLYRSRNFFVLVFERSEQKVEPDPTHHKLNYEDHG
jgi:hypothetical protein